MRNRHVFKIRKVLQGFVNLLFAVIIAIGSVNLTAIAANNDIMVQSGAGEVANPAGVKITAAGSLTGVNAITTTGNVNVGNNLNVTGQTSLQDRLIMNGNNIDMSDATHTVSGGNLNMYGGNINMGTDPVTSTVGNINMNGGNVNMGGGNINNVHNLTVNNNLTVSGVSNMTGAFSAYNPDGSGSGNIGLGSIPSPLGVNGAYIGYDNWSTNTVHGLVATGSNVMVGSYNYDTGSMHGLTVDSVLNTTTLSGGTNSTTWTLSDTGAVLSDSTNGNTFSVDNNGNAFIAGNLDMNGKDINNANNITATTFIGHLQGMADTVGANGVNTAAIQDGAVTTDKIADLAVTTAKIADSAVTNAKLADDSVSTSKIQDSAVTTAKIADSAVTTAKIADYNVTSDKLADNIAIRGTLDVAGLTSTNGGLNNTGALTSNGGDVNLNTGAGVGNASLALTDGSGASLLYTNAAGQTHGITVGETSTVVSGGTNSTTLTLDDNGATFANTVTAGPARVTGVADGVNDFDAVNMRQFRTIEDAVQKANIGIASVSALAAIPGTLPGKRIAIGAGYGYFEDESAVAVGMKARLWDFMSVTAGLGFGVGRSNSTYSANAGFSFSF